MPFTVTIPVQFRDLDCMGHVNNAVYISYMEHGRVSFCAQFPELDFGTPCHCHPTSRLRWLNTKHKSCSVVFGQILSNPMRINTRKLPSGQSIDAFAHQWSGWHPRHIE